MTAQNLGRVVGLSAYETWLKQSGNTGKTEAQFLASLKGATGDKGNKGDTGAKGDKGNKGDTGAKGDKGNDGVVGSFSINASGDLIYTT